MRKILAFVNTASLVLLIASCKSAPSRPNLLEQKPAGVVGGKDQTPNKTDGEAKEVHKTPKNDERGAVDAILSGDDASCKEKPRGFGRKSMRLLTRDEYFNTLKDILKITENPTGGIPSETSVNGFASNVSSNQVTSQHLIGYVDTAISVADSIKSKLQTLVGCKEDAGTVCAQMVIAKLAAKLYRRPLTEAEKTLLLETYKKGLSVNAREGMTLLISTLLTSPHFLYRSEIGNAEGELDAYEIATALSFFFWGTSPDDELLENAANGKLLTEEGLKAQAVRLWKNSRSRFVTDQFAYGWLDSRAVLGSTKDPSIGATFTPSIQKAMFAEANDTFDFLMKLPNGTFESLIASDFTIGTAELASFYNGQSVMEDGVTKIKFGASGRKGLVTLGGMLASHSASDESHPIKRGDYVLQKMLCFVPPPTPEGLDVKIPPKDPTKSTRERFAAHSSNPGCKGCHVKLDGIGFGLEDYDTLGRFRDKDQTGKAIDASGTMFGVDGKNTPFNGGGQLANEISKSSEAKRCFVVQWYRYAHGRTISVKDPDLCASRDIAMKFSEGKIPLGELLIKIVTDSSYTKRGE